MCFYVVNMQVRIYHKKTKNHAKTRKIVEKPTKRARDWKERKITGLMVILFGALMHETKILKTNLKPEGS